RCCRSSFGCVRSGRRASRRSRARSYDGNAPRRLPVPLQSFRFPPSGSPAELEIPASPASQSSPALLPSVLLGNVSPAPARRPGIDALLKPGSGCASLRDPAMKGSAMPADDHTHDHGSELSEMQLRVRALETILTEKGY